jgi:hypothetical protein
MIGEEYMIMRFSNIIILHAPTTSDIATIPEILIKNRGMKRMTSLKKL